VTTVLLINLHAIILPRYTEDLVLGLCMLATPSTEQLLLLCSQRASKMVSVSCGANVRAQIEVNVMYQHVDSLFQL